MRNLAFAILFGLSGAASSQSEVDHILVLDRSASMANDAKFIAAQNAANFYIDMTPNGDGLGVVPFATNAGPSVFTLQAITTVPNTRFLAENWVDSLTMGTLTSIGDGMSLASDQAQASATGNSNCTFLLISDGIQNAPSSWSSVSANVTDSGCSAYTIAVGPAADEALLQNIAGELDGRYLYGPGPGADAPDVAANNLSVGNLSEFANAMSRGRQRLLHEIGTVPTFRSEFELPPDQIYTVYVDEGVSRLSFMLDWHSINEPDCDNPAVSNGCFGKDLALRLIRPDGTEISPTMLPYAFEDIVSGHVGWTVVVPDAGEWTLVVNADSFYTWYDIPFQVIVSGEADFSADLILDDQTGNRHLSGSWVPIQAQLSAATSLESAEVIATVTAPDGGETSVTLCDDGMHDDGAAGDGRYAAYYAYTHQTTRLGDSSELGLPLLRPPYEGSYQVELHATIGALQRESLGAFVVTRDPVMVFRDDFERAPSAGGCIDS